MTEQGRAGLPALIELIEADTARYGIEPPTLEELPPGIEPEMLLRARRLPPPDAPELTTQPRPTEE